jgi:small-conductance mechanosensitive channel
MKYFLYRFFIFFWIVMLLGFGSFSLQAQQGEPAGFSDPAAIASRLATVQAELAASTDEPNSTRMELLQELEASIIQHLEAYDFLQQVNEQSQLATRAATEWKGLDQPPPYSVVFVDRLRSELRGLSRRTDAIDSRLRLVNHGIEDASHQLDEHQRKRRQYMETATSTTDPVKRQEAMLAADLQEIESRIQAEAVARLQLRKDSHDVLAATIADGMRLVAQKISATSGQVVFSKEEFDQLTAEVETERAALVDASLASSDSVSGLGEQSSWKLEFLVLEKEYWTELFQAMNSESDSERTAAIDRIMEIKKKADDWAEALRLQVRDAAETGMQDIGLQVSADDFSRVMRLQDRAVFALEQLADEGIERSPVYARVVDGLQSVWGLELYLAEETSSVGGNKVTSYRAVTLGKLLRLCFILAVGWFLLGYLSRLVRSLVARRENVSQDTIDSAGSWTFGIGLALLIVIGLNRVHIPFTAFAFLGGTLAIGIGFGAQTLLKNFISGIILSLERPFRVGDLVQLEDLTGRIVKIGLRASVIRHLDGIDSLVPNSTLLENRVSNWTFGDSSVRGEITVGVAYGSPTREVARCLLSVAEEHGLVLKKPKPEVRFADFGDSALVFRLLYWFDAMKIQREPLASDLRYMIDNMLAEAGIVMAFPQRDIHFDNDKPIRIELSNPGSETGKQAGAQTGPNP